MTSTQTSGKGTKEDPWNLKTPPGTSDFQMYRDEKADPPALVCIVGKTELRYQLRCLDDLHSMLKTRGDCLARPTSRSQLPMARSRRGAVRPTTRSAAGTG